MPLLWRRRQKKVVALMKSKNKSVSNDMPKRTPILCVDFDGVLHSYVSVWKGPRNIPDPPVEGSIAWLDSLVEDGESVCAMAPRFRAFDVQIFSSRNRYFGGRTAIKKWLVKWGFPKDKLENLKFPLLKPPAFLLVDDRAWTFTGTFPSENQMLEFRPWNKRLPRPTIEELEKMLADTDSDSRQIQILPDGSIRA